jgi:hypothetical protein
MGTRSDIIVEQANGTWKRIYCHWDGYVSHNGRILFDHYNSAKLAEAVVKPGDMSSLGPKCSKPQGHSFDNRKPGYSVYYGRDRGETGTEGTIGASLSEVWPDTETGTEYTYVFMRDRPEDNFIGGWFVGDADEGQQSLVRLGDVLSGQSAEPTPNVKAFGGNFVIGRRKSAS